MLMPASAVTDAITTPLSYTQSRADDVSAHLQPGLELLARDLAVPVDVEGLEGCLQVLRLIERCQVERSGQKLL